MSSNKIGGLEQFLLKLMQTTDYKYVFIYNDKPKSEEFINSIHENGGNIVVLNTSGFNFVRNVLHYIKLLIKYTPSIVHFHFENSFVLYAPLAKMLGVNLVLKTQHSCITDSTMKQVFSKNQLSLKKRLLTLNGLAYNFLDYIIFVSDYTRTQYLKIYGDKYSRKSKTIYLGIQEKEHLSTKSVNELKASLNIDVENIVVSTILFANPIKGVDVLIKSIPYIKSRKLTFLIVGMDENNEYTIIMKELSKSLGVFDRIRWVGVTDNVYRYLSISDIYVQPSRTEALGLASVEAMSYALPVIASNVGGLPELTPLLFPNESSKDLANILFSLSSDDKKRKMYGMNSLHQFKEKFQLVENVKSYSNLYLE